MNRLRWRDFRLYVITDPRLKKGRSIQALALRAARGGAGLIQVRDKITPPGLMERQAAGLHQILEKEGVPLVINDWPVLASRIGAEGVHVGQNDLSVSEARKLAPGAFVGKSSHNLDQALQAQEEGADYVALGPVFPTRTKRRGNPPVGLDLLEKAASRIRAPWVAIGGIDQGNLPQVLEAGARRIAVVTAVTTAADPEASCRKLLDLILRYHL